MCFCVHVFVFVCVCVCMCACVSVCSQAHPEGQRLHGVLTRGLLALGGVSLLALGGVSVLAVTAVLLLDNWGYGVDLAPTNDLWKTVHDLFLRYCDKQYKCLPPV